MQHTPFVCEALPERQLNWFWAWGLEMQLRQQVQALRTVPNILANAHATDAAFTGADAWSTDAYSNSPSNIRSNAQANTTSHFRRLEVDACTNTPPNDARSNATNAYSNIHSYTQTNTSSDDSQQTKHR